MSAQLNNTAGQSRARLKPVAVEAALSTFRAYMRFFPVDYGKAYAWEKFYDRYFNWRTELRPRVVRTRFGFKMQVKLPDEIQKVVLLTGRWEPFLTRFVRDTLRPGDTFVDLGANIGYYSLLASRIIGERGHVYSIEGSPSIFDSLKDNIARNKVTNITAINAIVSNKEGRRPFWRAPDPRGGHSTAIESVASQKRMPFEAYVSSDCLVNLIPTETLFDARLIKVDVEGAEAEVLSPLFPLLGSFSKRTTWMVELSPHLCPGGQATVDEIFQGFRGGGYQPFEVPNVYSPESYLAKASSASLRELTRSPTSQTDVVFVRP